MTPDQARSFAQSLGLSLRYETNTSLLTPAAGQIVQLDLDQVGADYVDSSSRARHGKIVTWLHRSLRGLLSDFDINGYLGTYPMHVLSSDQWRELLGGAPGGRLLDVGAGRGDVTASLARLFDETTTTETSKGMAKRLAKKGYRVLRQDLAESPVQERFDAVSLLNVLDRCDRPLSLLGAARSALCAGGLLIIALVLPYSPFVYDGGRTRAPRERLPITSKEFERAASEFIDLSLLALGLEVVTVSRAPYLSGGDAQAQLYELDDLLVVCRALGEPPPILGGGV